MSEPKVSVKAVVTLTVEVYVDDAWGGDCPMSQVSKQARDAAENRLRLVRSGGGSSGWVDDGKIRIVGEAIVKAVIVEEKR